MATDTKTLAIDKETKLILYYKCGKNCVEGGSARCTNQMTSCINNTGYCITPTKCYYFLFFFFVLFFSSWQRGKLNSLFQTHLENSIQVIFKGHWWSDEHQKWSHPFRQTTKSNNSANIFELWDHTTSCKRTN